MPSPQADTLARSFRASQISLSAVSATLVREAWNRTIQPSDIQGSATRWLVLAAAIIVRYRAQSAALGTKYYTLMRALELPDAPHFQPPSPDLLDPRFLHSSLWAMGPAELLKVRELISPDQDPVLAVKMVMAQVGEAIEGSAIRHVQNGGRAAINQARVADPVIVGYYRETDGDPCYFCSMLSSRGAVYAADSFDESDARFEGPGKIKVHDSCACHNRPIFIRGDKFPGLTKSAQDLWISMPTTYRGAPTSGANAIRAYRHVFNESLKNKS